MVRHVGTGIHPAFLITNLGFKVCAALRLHKAEGGKYGTFRWDASSLSEEKGE